MLTLSERDQKHAVGDCSDRLLFKRAAEITRRNEANPAVLASHVQVELELGSAWHVALCEA